MKRTTMILMTVLLISIWSGCVTQKMGNELDPDKVAKIEKGVTTKDEVISLLGPPSNIQLLPDGRRVMTYTYSITKARATAGAYVPVVGGLIGGAKGESRIQTLQVNLNVDQVVEDYELSDGTSKIKGSVWGSESKRTSP